MMFVEPGIVNTNVLAYARGEVGLQSPKRRLHSYFTFGSYSHRRCSTKIFCPLQTERERLLPLVDAKKEKDAQRVQPHNGVVVGDGVRGLSVDCTLARGLKAPASLSAGEVPNAGDKDRENRMKRDCRP